MIDAYIGQIMLVAWDFEPQDWAFCDRRLLPIGQYTALFSLIGTYYGGNGASSFALPDLRGRVPVGRGEAPGLSRYSIGDKGGVETVKLTVNEMPAHTHELRASDAVPNAVRPGGAVPASGGSYATGEPTIAMRSDAISSVGEGAPHDNRQPYLGLNYVICLSGSYPPRR